VELRLVPAWLVVLIITREFLVTGLRLLAGREGGVLSADAWGKHKTVWQMLVIAVVLLGLAVQHDLLPHWRLFNPGDFDQFFHQSAYVISWIAAVITTVSGAAYFSKHRALFVRHAEGAAS